jgi:hypothetical protein
MDDLFTEERKHVISASIKRVIDNEKYDWKEKYEILFIKFAEKNKFFTGDQIKAHMIMVGLEYPHHHNVWGAMVSSMNKKGYMESIGIRTPMSKHNHMNSVNWWKSNLIKGGRNG